jgi:hypothetical protein
MILITFVELCVVAGRSRTRAGCPHAVSGRPILIHNAMPMPRCAVALESRFQNDMVVAWHGRGMVCVNQKRPHCANQMGKTQSKPLAARHARGTAWYVRITLYSSHDTYTPYILCVRTCVMLKLCIFFIMNRKYRAPGRSGD